MASGVHFSVSIHYVQGDSPLSECSSPLFSPLIMQLRKSDFVIFKHTPRPQIIYKNTSDFLFHL